MRIKCKCAGPITKESLGTCYQRKWLSLVSHDSSVVILWKWFKKKEYVARVKWRKEITVQRSQYMAPRPQLLSPMKEIQLTMHGISPGLTLIIFSICIRLENFLQKQWPDGKKWSTIKIKSGLLWASSWWVYEVPALSKRLSPLNLGSYVTKGNYTLDTTTEELFCIACVHVRKQILPLHVQISFFFLTCCYSLL